MSDRIDRILDILDAGDQHSNEASYGHDRGGCWRCGTSRGEILDVGLCVPCRNDLSSDDPLPTPEPDVVDAPRGWTSASEPLVFQVAPMRRPVDPVAFRERLLSQGRVGPPWDSAPWDATLRATVAWNVGRAVVGEVARIIERRRLPVEVLSAERGQDLTGLVDIRVHVVEMQARLETQAGLGKVIDLLARSAVDKIRQLAPRVVWVPDPIDGDCVEAWGEEGTTYVHFNLRLVTDLRAPVYEPHFDAARINGCSETTGLRRPWTSNPVPYGVYPTDRASEVLSEVVAPRARVGWPTFDRWQRERGLGRPQPHEETLVVGGRRGGRSAAFREQLAQAYAYGWGAEVRVIGPDGIRTYHPDGTFTHEPAEIRGYQATEIIRDEVDATSDPDEPVVFVDLHADTSGFVQQVEGAVDRVEWAAWLLEDT